MKEYILGLLGMWLLSDALYSLALYLSAPGVDGKKQTWLRDHWLRVVRAGCGIVLIIWNAP